MIPWPTPRAIRCGSGQPARAAIFDEIAADTGLYLSRTQDYDNILVFIWDDAAQTEHHYELQSGVETLRADSGHVEA
jgi:hypothetical protein